MSKNSYFLLMFFTHVFLLMTYIILIFILIFSFEHKCSPENSEKSTLSLWFISIYYYIFLNNY